VQVSQREKKVRILVRSTVLDYYGGQCVLCGETNQELLSLDHIDGNGRKHRKEVLGGTDSGSAFFKWVLKNKPNNIRLLCYNCNCQNNMNKVEMTVQYEEGCQFCGEERMHHRHTCQKCKTQIKRNHYIDLKMEVFAHYGCQCANCGIDKIEFLTIDHINNNGAEHRKQIGTQIYPWLKKNKYPADFQVLCYNCNYLKRNQKLASTWDATRLPCAAQISLTTP
jgi:hypothetical protein